MPSIATICADLNAGTVTGVGSKPDSGDTNAMSVISATHNLKHLSVHMKATITPGGRLSCVGAERSSDFNGNYVHYADGFATAGAMDMNRPLVVSGNFSGCLWKVYRAPPEGVTDGRYAGYKCVHIARPGGANSDALVIKVNAYAQTAGWTEIHAVPTAGFLPPQGEIMMVTQFFPNVRIDTVRLQISNAGIIVGKTLFSTPI